MPAKKYIFEGGVMKINPEYTKETTSSTSTPPPYVPPSDQPLAIISSMEDISSATIAQQEATGLPMNLAPSTVATFDAVQDDSYVNKFQAGTDGSDLLEGLTNYC